MGISTFAPVNQEVNVNSFYFRNQANSLRSFPQEIEYQGRHIAFAQSGLRLLVKSGQRLAQLFDMSDGQDIYRLKLEGRSLDPNWRQGGNSMNREATMSENYSSKEYTWMMMQHYWPGAIELESACTPDFPTQRPTSAVRHLA